MNKYPYKRWDGGIGLVEAKKAEQETIKNKADTLVEVMNIINSSYSLAEAKKAINKITIEALKNYHNQRVE